MTDLQGNPELPGAGLRVLHVTNMWPEGDSFRGIFVREQVDALRALGVHVDLEILAQSRGRRDYLLAIPRIRRLARAGDYDLVHVHHGMSGLATRFVGRVPRILNLYGHDVNWHWQRWITRMGWGGVADKVYVSHRMAVAAGDPDGEVIPNGVDFALLSPGDRQAARAALGIAEHEKVVLFGAVPANWVKGHDVFTDVLAELTRRGWPVRELVLAEPGQSRAGIVPKFLAADVLLFTSRKGYEGSPTVVKEATAINLPVVTTDVGDVKDVLRGVHPSAVVDFPEPWGTPETRAQLVEGLVARCAEVFEHGGRSNGREVNAWLDWDVIGRQIVDHYRRVLAEAGPQRRDLSRR